MDVFDLRNRLIHDYREYIESFITIRDPDIRARVGESLDSGSLWPDPLIALNPAFASGGQIADLVAAGVLDPECARIFRIKRHPTDPGRDLRLHRHQREAITIARGGHNYVLTTGTGSGKSLAYIVPIVDHVLRRGSGKGVQAIVVYPMNALANSQEGELEKFLCYGYSDGQSPVTFAKYTGQESETRREAIRARPPDILLTNYVMLELLLTRPREAGLIAQAQGLQFLVLDELHTYRGRQGADVAMLVRRVRDRVASPRLQTVGTSATLAGAGTFAQQQAEVAAVATQLFGAPVAPDHIIGETLKRVTPQRDPLDPAFVTALTARVQAGAAPLPADYAGFVADPLASWLESTFGVVTAPEGGRLVRATPRSITGDDGAAQDLARTTDLPADRCAVAIMDGLLAGNLCAPDPETERPPFAFRLHQFISRGDAVYATLEAPGTRYITVSKQIFEPGNREHHLFPVVFCRECGQEYYSVRRAGHRGTEHRPYTDRDVGDMDDAEGEPGYLYLNPAVPWPMADSEVAARLPAEWVEMQDGLPRVLKDRRPHIPLTVYVAPDGAADDTGLEAQYVTAPFRFCLACGVSYDFLQRSDFAKLGGLSAGGRSTATTLLSLAVVRHLRGATDLDLKARKLLSFLDNRQDASLQAGHFNDFIEIGLLRGALYRAVAAYPDGIPYHQLPQRVFEALNLSLSDYASNPAVKFQGRKETDQALRDVLGYRLYRDLKRGWRVTAPNLEQCGLLDVQYQSLDELCADAETWAGRHPILATATPAIRMKVARTLLDYMRRELVIKVEFLDSYQQEGIQQKSNQYLIAPWALDEAETAKGKMEYAATLYPRPRRPSDDRSNLFVSNRGGFGQYLRRTTTFPHQRPPFAEVPAIIADLLSALAEAGIVEVVDPADPAKADDCPGYQIQAGAMLWRAGEGTRVERDPIRVPSESAQDAPPNPFFSEFYRLVAGTLHGLEAREHTAQVPYALREEREDRFRAGTLPILYCSPTMELGVDISELNVVNLRNVPPTPANYAQRSGRAGRSGQPALVFTYCTTGSPHDQYFFRHQAAMVAGAVTPPRLDLTNQDLIRSHMHAIWLTETGQDLKTSLRDLLDLDGETPSLALLPDVRQYIESPHALGKARVRAAAVLATIQTELDHADWYHAGWLDEVLAGAARQFDDTCTRWRTLYRAAERQRIVQNRVIGDASRLQYDKDEAKRLRGEAESQIKLLIDSDARGQSDFYSYRYFASEGFLPGYAFPRLPISAFIPARRLKGPDEFLSRPRFLAVEEFGPRAIVYHEGSRYLIHKAILPVAEGDSANPQERIALSDTKICEACGYLHPILSGDGPDLCERCAAPLKRRLHRLFRMQNVATKRKDRINSDEEERQRQGYEILTGVRFGEENGRMVATQATIRDGDAVLGSLVYGPAATLWRINLGWSRRKDPGTFGFTLDLERGYWAANEATEDAETADPLSATKARVIPYVEDRRNCLIFSPALDLEAGQIVSLMAALKSAIQVRYQLEDSELAVEALPSRNDPRSMLFYESAEGGAGVLRRLIDDPPALAAVAREALRICHFDPITGDDRRRAPDAIEDCEAACYACLMSYSNQALHRVLDRQAIRDNLRDLAAATVEAGSGGVPRGEHLAALGDQAESTLESAWLAYMDARGLRLPSRAQVFIAECGTRPDFLYDGEYNVAIYVDGPVHEFAHRAARDVAQADRMMDAGYTVIRFAHNSDWDAVIGNYPYVFGTPQAPASVRSTVAVDR